MDGMTVLFISLLARSPAPRPEAPTPPPVAMAQPSFRLLDDDVVAGAAVEDVVTGASVQHVVAGVAEQRVVTGAADEHVVAVAAVSGQLHGRCGELRRVEH